MVYGLIAISGGDGWEPVLGDYLAREPAAVRIRDVFMYP
jgi:hypothetical protein